MNNQEFLDELSRRVGMTDEQTAQLVTSVAGLIEQHLQEGDRVDMEPFGVFSVRKEQEYIALHPVSGRRMLVPPRLVVDFHPYAEWSVNTEKTYE